MNTGKQRRLTSWYVGVLACGFLLTLPRTGQSGETAGTSTNRTTVATGVVDPIPEPSPAPVLTAQILEQIKANQQATLDALQHTQQQIGETAQTAELSRAEAEAAAKAMELRLKALEEQLTTQRKRDLASLQSSQRFTLVIVCLIAGLGMTGLLVVALFLLGLIRKRGDITGAAISIGQQHAARTLGTGEMGLTVGDPATQSSGQLLDALERIEKRMLELESGSQSPGATDYHAANGGMLAEPKTAEYARSQTAARVALLLGKGQSLMNLEQIDDALACFDECIALDPTNAEVFVKKGAALEKKSKLDEAIENYDKAIALDESLMMAYLCKGGVFNRLDRYNEALQCYEQALRVQQNTRVV